MRCFGGSTRSVTIAIQPSHIITNGSEVVPRSEPNPLGFAVNIIVELTRCFCVSPTRNKLLNLLHIRNYGAASEIGLTQPIH